MSVPPLAGLGRRSSRAGINDRKTSLPFIASGFALRFYLLCDELWGQSPALQMNGGSKCGIGNYVEVPSVFDGEGPSVRTDRAFRRLCPSSSRAPWACTTRRSPGNDGWRRCIAGHRCLCRAGPLWGSVATPARWRISRSPRRVRFIAFVDRIRYDTGRGTCAPGAPASPAGVVPPSAEPRHLVVCGGRRFAAHQMPTRC